MARLLVSLMVCFSLLPVDRLLAQESYEFGVVPQQSAAKLAQTWTPFLNWLSEKSGVSLRFSTAKDIPAFEQKLAQGGYGFAYMNPYHFTVFNRQPGYRALVHRADQPIRGIIVVRKDSAYRSLDDLRGATLAFPSPAAFAASVLPRAELKQQDIPFLTQYVSSHDSVYLNVEKGLFAAGGGVQRTFNNLPQPVKDQLRIVWETKPYTPHAIAVHPRVDVADRQRLLDVLTTMHDDPEGLALLRALQVKSRFVEAADSDWDDVRALQLELLDNFIQ